MTQDTSKDRLIAWLDAMDAAECADVLIAADVDLDVIRDLTDFDLRELGLSLGHRKRLLRGITALNQQERMESDPDHKRAERRQLSVLFCDLVGSTNLSTKLDAEEFATILQDYHRMCASIATQWGGRLIAEFGDGCMVIFGHPRMHEDDAERAIRAGQQMLSEIAQTGPFAGDYLKSRVAIATGRVVIGDLTGASHPDAMAGETPNLAARLQGTVDPQQLIIDDRTMRLVRHAFHLDPKGPQTLRGFDKPVDGWIVGNALETRSRYDMLSPDSMHDIFGRDAELQVLSERWKTAQSGQAQVVVLSGEPGIGKSWLISSFVSKLQAEVGNLRRLRLFCSAHHQSTALHPAIDQIRWTAGIRDDDDAQKIRKRLHQYFERMPDPQPGAADLVAAQILGSGGGVALELNAGQQKVAMFQLLHYLLTVDASNEPVLLEFEDAHWADPTSLELLEQIVNVAGDIAPQLRLMLIVTHRPEFRTNWPERPWIVHHELQRLSSADSAGLVKVITNTALPEARLREIVAKADGVPLYVREIARAVAAAGDDTVGAELEVPETLDSSLMARLDRLGTAKNIVQIAATLGRLFHEATLAQISGSDREELQAALTELVDAEVITPLPDVGVGAYLFRHALIQDAAYGSILLRERRDIHARAARVLENQQSTVQVAPEILARHYAGAEMPLEAVGKLIEAGRNATARAAQVEANNHYRTALGLLHDAPSDANSQSLEAMVQALLGQSLIATLGFGAPGIASSFERARHLSEQTENYPLLLGSIYGLWAVSAARGDREKSMSLTAEAIGLFGASEVPLFALAANFMDGVTRLYDGQLDNAEAALLKATELYDPSMYAHLMQAFGDDLGTFALIYLQWIRTLRGDLAGAAALTAKLSEISEQLDDRQIDTRNLGFSASGAQSVGAAEMAYELSNQLKDLATELCYPHWIATARINLGWAMCQLSEDDEDDEGVEEIEAGLAFFNLIGQRTPLSLCHGVQVESYLKVGRLDEANAAVEDALSTCDKSLDRLYVLDLRRLQAEIMAATDPSAAKSHLREVIFAAREQGMHYFELRAAVSLAAMTREGPDGAADRDLLQDARARITQPMPLPVTIAADQILADGRG